MGDAPSEMPHWLGQDGALERRLPSLAPLLRRAWGRLLPPGSASPDWGDLWAVILLATATVHLVAHDGGRPMDASIFAESLFVGYSGIVAVLGLSIPVLLTSSRELRRDRPIMRWLMFGWSVGPLVALVAAGVRDGWVRSLAPLAVAVPVFLAARRVWRAPWGPPVLGAIIIAAGLRAWNLGFLLWTSSVNTRHWPLLSWHNQTATIMGATLLVGLACLWVGGGRVTRVAGLLLSVFSASGLWLAASRGAFILTLVAMTAMLWLAFRSGRLVHAMAGTALVVVLAVPTVVVVAETRADVGASDSAENVEGATGSERALLDRGTDVDNLTMRFDYWRGAVSMFVSAPLTGTGPGSFAYAAPPHLQPGYYPTLSTHNEYLEVLGTLGLGGAVPIWGATIGVAWLVISALRRGRSPTRQAAKSDDSDLGGRTSGRIAAVGSLTLLGLHAGMDLDWLWPLLVVAAAIGSGVLHAEVCGRRPSGHRGTALVVIIGAMTLSAVAGAGAAVQRTGAALWDLPLTTEAVVRAVEADDLEEASRWLATAERWSPEAHDVVAVSSLLAYRRGDVPAGSLAGDIDPRGVRFPLQARIAAILLDDDEVVAAREVHDGSVAALSEAHGRHGGRQATYFNELRLADRAGGCGEVRSVWVDIRDRLVDDGMEPDVVARRWAQEHGESCDLP